MDVTPDMAVEDLVVRYPKAAGWLSKRGLKVVVCGEPYWGSLKELAAEDGIEGEALEQLVRELNEYLATEGSDLVVLQRD